jgi:hypothetical protein
MDIMVNSSSREVKVNGAGLFWTRSRKSNPRGFLLLVFVQTKQNFLIGVFFLP